MGSVSAPRSESSGAAIATHVIAAPERAEGPVGARSTAPQGAATVTAAGENGLLLAGEPGPRGGPGHGLPCGRARLSRVRAKARNRPEGK